MHFYSTNGEAPVVSFEQAVLRGLPEDGGLYMPEAIPKAPAGFLDPGVERSFEEIAGVILSPYTGPDIEPEALTQIISDAFSFDVIVRSLHRNMYVLELFHGPTLAFKDFGARFMARAMSYFNRNNQREIHILVATSGDTGSAVAQGFYGVEGIDVTLLYPKGKVSAIQEQQLTTVGGNVTALEVDGTFDDCQKMVKTAFGDQDLDGRMSLSSANSINIARLLPQSLYYAYAVSAMPPGTGNVVMSVPSGNFGNLCGGLIAKKMGLPVSLFLAATNINKVVPDYLSTGIFEPRPSIQTISNAMDVGNPSNFARIDALYDGDHEAIAGDMEGYFYTDEETREAIRRVYAQHQYLMCPHTAIGYAALEKVMNRRRYDAGICLSTAHPAKFKDIVEPLANTEVPVPDRLRRIIERKKQAIGIRASYDDFKSYLLEKS